MAACRAMRTSGGGTKARGAGFGAFHIDGQRLRFELASTRGGSGSLRRGLRLLTSGGGTNGRSDLRGSHRDHIRQSQRLRSLRYGGGSGVQIIGAGFASSLIARHHGLRRLHSAPAAGRLSPAPPGSDFRQLIR